MKLRKMSVLLVPTVILAVSGCQSTGLKETAGTVLGAAVGGVLGSKVGKGTGNDIAIGAGTLAGAFVGKEIGRSLDNADRAVGQGYD
ncbi:MAG: glycine zipper 2TM domain-containing protein [Rhodospirillaceae bacterium]|nr:glycine zipper 2TM domain-containing protein [Rhodospirillaceae bacterium]